MAYDDSRFRGEPGYRGDTAPGDTPAFGGDSGASAYQPGSYSYSANEYPSSGYPATDYTIKDPEERTDGVSRQVAGAPSLDDVFDDPTQGEPGRDRMGVHLVWELILLLAAAAVGYLLYRGHRSAVTGDGLRELMISTTTLGLLILGAGLSLRAAVPNLAVGPIALASSMFFAEHAHDGLLVTAVQTGFLAVAAGAIIALVVVGLHVPAWAASFGAGLAVVVWIQAQRGTLKLPAGVYQPTDHATYWLGGFVILAFLGGLLGSIKSIRRAVGRSRAISDPADRRGGAAAAMAVVALLASSVLAAAAGAGCSARSSPRCCSRSCCATWMSPTGTCRCWRWRLPRSASVWSRRAWSRRSGIRAPRLRARSSIGGRSHRPAPPPRPTTAAGAVPARPAGPARCPRPARTTGGAATTPGAAAERRR